VIYAITDYMQSEINRFLFILAIINNIALSSYGLLNSIAYGSIVLKYKYRARVESSDQFISLHEEDSLN
jgi:hypothetical protein